MDVKLKKGFGAIETPSRIFDDVQALYVSALLGIELTPAYGWLPIPTKKCVRYNGFATAKKHQLYLNQQTHRIEQLLTGLPLLTCSGENRQAVLHSLRSTIQCASRKIAEDIRKWAGPRQHSQGGRRAAWITSLLTYVDRNRNNRSRIYQMYAAHQRALTHITKLIDMHIAYEKQQSIEAVPHHEHEPENGTSEAINLPERTKVQVSLPVLSRAMLLCLKQMAGHSKVNKRSLARLIATHFSTVDAQQPSASSVYNAFYLNKPSTSERVKAIAISMLNHCKV